jgi:cytochrome c oxidase subunit 2
MNFPARFDRVFRVEVIVAVVVFALVAGAFVFAIVRSFTPRGASASQKTSHKKTEMLYVSVVAAVAAGLIVFSLSQNTSPHPRPAMTVKVTGFQWCWRFDYPGTGVSVTADCVDGHLPTLVLPAGEPIEVQVTSADVIHSMWIPYLRFKLLAYPGYVNFFETTLSSSGSWQGECAELCGQYHYAMHFILKAVTRSQFRAWLASQPGVGS